jgi:hypothetical protein
LPEIIGNLPVHIRLISKEETDDAGSLDCFHLGELDYKSKKISHPSLYDRPIVYTITHEYATVPKRQKQESPPPHGEM